MSAPNAAALLTDQVRDLIPEALAGLVEEFALGATDVHLLRLSKDFDTACYEWDEPEPFRECFTMAADFAAFCTSRGTDAWRNLRANVHPDGPRRTDPNDMGPGADGIGCPLIWRAAHRFGHPQFADPEFPCTIG
ncbi:hypothetical protein [Catenulispora rubra]|uniref:hypothetical protein n=1 Tax=Catenulispora rubra TaxID=280293 RepID=UPI0018924264|nr:hypothetical protein [Catenulispora rubra]